MSHFTVLVIGDNIEEQLAPYDENLEMEPYKRAMSEKDIEGMKRHYGEVSPEDLVLHMKDWSGNEGYLEDGGLGYWTTYNPESKWDWYSIGGRWSGAFLLKDLSEEHLLGEPGVGDNRPKYHADQARKGNIDWEKIGLENQETAHQDYRLHANSEDAWLYGIKKGETEEEYVNSRSKFSCYAILKDGVWHSKGEMGWWGMGHDEKSEEEWHKRTEELINSASDDDLFTLVDCHI